MSTCPRESRRLEQAFYLAPAVEVVRAFLGKMLVHQTELGRVSGVICDVEAYPAFADGVHHGNKRTSRSEVMWQTGGRAYVYLIYGMWHQFAAVVNLEGIPDVVFVRGVVPLEGVDVMASQWDQPRPANTLANSPGKLCKSFQITRDQYGTDLCGDELFLEDHGVRVAAQQIRTAERVGINKARAGSDRPWRFFVKPAAMADLMRAAGCEHTS
ncbi:DNA-3-methyladenine glycosylase [Flindersiella endophytica]